MSKYFVVDTPKTDKELTTISHLELMLKILKSQEEFEVGLNEDQKNEIQRTIASAFYYGNILATKYNMTIEELVVSEDNEEHRCMVIK